MADRTPTTATPPGRVLVVDDEQPLAQMVASYLIRAGFDTRQAHTGTQAVDEACRFSPDVVVLDLGLPDMDGLTVLVARPAGQAEALCALIEADGGRALPLPLAASGAGRGRVQPGIRLRR